jgi:hypothetical protein
VRWRSEAAGRAWHGLAWPGAARPGKARFGTELLKGERAMAAKPKLQVIEGDTQVFIAPINLVELRLKIAGTAPLVMNAFSEKARQQLETHMATPQKQQRTRKERTPREYDAEFESAHHRDKEGGWVGVPANGFRACAISGTRLVPGVMMSRAKQALFIRPDGWDKVDGQGLVRLIEDEAAEKTLMHVRNRGAMGKSVVDLRCRPMWRKWSCIITIRFDADFMTAEHVINLFNRGGVSVGICEGRPDSPNSNGMGWGTFEIVGALNPEKREMPDAKKMLALLDADAVDPTEPPKED